MFAKIFEQIFDSSIAEDYVVRHVFMDLLVLCDREGVVDMTVEAISRRTFVPLDMIRHSIDRLCEPDQASRSHIEDGKRLVLLDSHRDWGWQIVNYEHYRNIVDQESRKAYFRDKARAYRAGKKPENIQPQTAEPERRAENVTPPTAGIKPNGKAPAGKGTRIPDSFYVTVDMLKWAQDEGFDSPDLYIAAFRDYWKGRPGAGGVKLDWEATFRNWIRRESAGKKPLADAAVGRNPVKVKHGVNCFKEPHGAQANYGHGAKDDAPFTVEEIKYCGRCHEVL